MESIASGSRTNKSCYPRPKTTANNSIPDAKGDRIELVCNECGIVGGSIDDAILRAVVRSGIQHAAGGCSGDIVVNRFRGEQAELRCDKCGIVAGLVNPGIWADLVSVEPRGADRL